MTRSSRFATAVHILTLLAMKKDEPVTSDFVAGSVTTNPVVIRRLLRKLAEAGLVSSSPGGAGGSRLARDPRQITLYDAYSAVESEPLFGEHSQRPNLRCPVGKNIVEVLEPRVHAAEAAAAATLRKTTIADLVSDLRRLT